MGSQTAEEPPKADSMAQCRPHLGSARHSPKVCGASKIHGSVLSFTSQTTGEKRNGKDDEQNTVAVLIVFLLT